MVWIEGYDPVDVASVYIRCTGFLIIFRARLLYHREKKRKEKWCFDEELRSLGVMNLISGTEER